MERRESVATMLRAQCVCYPKLRAQDLLKALHQSVLGCGHLVVDEAGGLERLRQEAETACDAAGIEVLGRDYCRVHLGFLKESGLSVESLFRLFVHSAEEPLGDEAALEEGLDVLLALSAAGELPVPHDEMTAAAAEWRTAGFPLCRHSEAFREAYSPAYRVIRRDFLWKMRLMAEIDRLLQKKEQVLVAVEGGAGSGKTTLAAWLGGVYDCNVFHMDDYFLRPEQRTAERLAEIGGNADRERFLEEVLLPLRWEDAVQSRRYDCCTQTLQPPAVYEPKRLNLIEGAYCLHPELAGQYDLKVFLKISPERQRERILRRNSPDFAERFFKEWIPMEQRYFEAMEIEKSCHITVEVET